MKKALSLLLALLMLFSCMGSVFATGDAPVTREEVPAVEDPADVPADEPADVPEAPAEQPVVGPEILDELPPPEEDEPEDADIETRDGDLFTGGVWVPVPYTELELSYYEWSSITPYLIVFENDSGSYAAVNYNVYNSAHDHLYYETSSNRFGYTAPVEKIGNDIVAVNGMNATDFQYCEWYFFYNNNNQGSWSIISNYNTNVAMTAYGYPLNWANENSEPYYNWHYDTVNERLYNNNLYLRNVEDTTGNDRMIAVATPKTGEQTHFYRKLSGHSGQCGDNLYWIIDEATGELRIFGTGTMYDYNASDNRAPWYQYRSSITSVYIEEGVTGLGNYSFYSCSYIVTVNIPASLQTIGNWAFCYTSSLKAFEVSENNQYFANYTDGFGGELYSKDKKTLLYYTAGDNTANVNSDFTVGILVENIGPGAFVGAYYLDRVYVQGDIDTIGQSAFFNCIRLSTVVFEGNVRALGYQAFRGCSSLRTLLFLKEKPTSVSAYVFTDCPEDLYVYYTEYYAYSWALNGETEWNYSGSNTLPMAVCSGTMWVPTEKIIADVNEGSEVQFGRGFLIELRHTNTSGVTKHCIAVNYDVEGDRYYYSAGDTKFGLTAAAVMNGSSIVGVNGRFATDLSYCQWRFAKAVGYNRYSISSVYGNYVNKLNKDCYPEELSDSAAKIWYYSANDLYNYQNNVKYHAVYSWLSTLDWMTTESDDTYSSQESDRSVHLYRPVSESFVHGYSGKCGDNLYWQLNADTAYDNYGELRIFGTGAMYNYNTSDNRAPWYQYKDAVTSIVIEEGATSIGYYAFVNMYNATEVSIPASVTTLSSMAFQLSDKIEAYTVAADNQYFCDVDGILFNKDMTHLYNYPPSMPGIDYTVPDGVTTIEPGAFIWSHYLDTVIIPESVTFLGTAVFFYAQMLSTVVIRGSITRLNTQEFYGAKNLHSIIFLGETPGTVGANLFYNNPSDLCVYYTEPYAYSWAPNGETEWSYDGTNTLPLAVFGGEAWVPTETVVANAFVEVQAESATPQLIGINKNGTTYLFVCYNEYSTGTWRDHLYLEYTSGNTYHSHVYLSSAVRSGNHVVGVNGANATNLEYCKWYFVGTQNSAPYSIITPYDYMVEIWDSHPSAYEPGPNSGTMYYQNHRLYSVVNSAYRYMGYYNNGTYDLTDTYSSQPSDESVQLYRLLTLDITAIGGKCGDTLYWQLDPDTGVLRIFGTGAMYNYSSDASNRAPWFDHRSEITSVVVEEGATTVGANAFANCYRLVTVSLPSTLTTFSNSAVNYAASLEEFIVASGNQTFSTIDGVLFSSNGTMLHRYPEGKTEGTYFVPDGVTGIGIQAFTLTQADTVVLPESVDTFMLQAFAKSYSLLNIIALGGKPTSTGQGIFNDCNSELCIYYTAAHANEWAPNGETTWKTIPIYLIDGETWFVTSHITPGEDCLIGFVDDNDNTHLAVNYRPGAAGSGSANNYYLSISGNYYGWSAPAYKNGTAVTGVHGNVDDLLYCSWRFQGEDDCLIESAYESGRYLQSYTGTNYGDLYAGTNSNYKWTYDPADMALWTYTTDYRYANYYTDGTNDLMRVSGNCESMVMLYHKIDLPIDEPEIIYGDVDGNGVVDMSDVSMLFSYLNGGTELSPEALEAADVNRDGFVNIMDISAIYSIIANS